MNTVALTSSKFSDTLRRAWDYVNPFYRNPTRTTLGAFGDEVSSAPAMRINNPHLLQRQMIAYMGQDRHLSNALMERGEGEYLLIASVVDGKLRISVHATSLESVDGQQVYDVNWAKHGAVRFLLTLDAKHNGTIEPIHGVRWRCYANVDEIDSLLESPLPEHVLSDWTRDK